LVEVTLAAAARHRDLFVMLAAPHNCRRSTGNARSLLAAA
jgi:hypothetical protein